MEQDLIEDLPKRIARNVWRLRRALGASQAQLARVAKLPRATLANVESGAANPTIIVLCKVAMALRVTVGDLIAATEATTGQVKPTP